MYLLRCILLDGEPPSGYTASGRYYTNGIGAASTGALYEHSFGNTNFSPFSSKKQFFTSSSHPVVSSLGGAGASGKVLPTAGTGGASGRGAHAHANAAGSAKGRGNQTTTSPMTGVQDADDLACHSYEETTLPE
jgi:hypothetical protein